VPLALILALLLYWLFARYLERLDLFPVIAPWWQTWVPFLPLPGWLVSLAEFFHPRVLRHLLPVIVGWLLAQRASVNMLQTLYNLPDRDTAAAFLGRLRGGRPTGKAVAVTGSTLDETRAKSDVVRVGGPGRIKVRGGEAAVTEINGRFHRVLGPGGHALSRFEYVHALIDLRQQARTETDIPLVTRDGIEVGADIHLTYRIDTGGEPATPTTPFPFQETAVRAAAYAQTLSPQGEVNDWNVLPGRLARAILGKIFAQYQLDDILHLSGQAVEPYVIIQNDLKRQLMPRLEEKGIELNDVLINRISFPDAVTAQYVQHWQAHWETRARINQADGQAAALEETERARAEAEMTMVEAIMEGMARARREGHRGAMSEVVALRLIETMEQMARRSQQVTALPPQLLPRLHLLRRDLLPERAREREGEPGQGEA
jgi:regulator of protease activity HflC (stomatin/prohibitin superfamily)